MVERELLRLLVNYGTQNTTQVYTDENGQDVDLITNVCAYIVSEIKQEGFSMTVPAHQALFSIFADALDKAYVPRVEDLLLCEDDGIRRMVADLAASPYEISQNWEKKGIFVKTEQTDKSTLDEAVTEAVLAFKLCRIQGMLESLDKEMSGCVEAKDELRLMELIKQKQDLDRHKVFLCGMLRRVV